MNTNEENIISDAPAEDIGADGSEKERPPRDPKNGLYTVLSILIFIIGTVIYKLMASNIMLVYALHETHPGDQLKTAVYQQMEIPDLPSDIELIYIRLHHNFDDDRMYLAFTLPEDMDEETFAESFIPYQCGNTVVDQRFAVYPRPDANAHYVYGDMYVCIDDPLRSCLVYEEDGSTYAVYSRTDYDRGITALFDTEKIGI